MVKKLPCKVLIQSFKTDYFNKGGTITTWSGDYEKIFRRLPPGAPLTEELSLNLISSTTPNTRTRKRAAMALGRLARHAGIRCDTASYAGSYNSRRNKADVLPTDDQILVYGLGLTNKSWRRIYGLIAIYGLRPHEAFFVDDSKIATPDPVIQVLQGKTGPRFCYPYPADWIRKFALHQPWGLPNVNLDRPNEAIGHSVTAYFSRLKAPFNLYALRHRHALRMREAGVLDHYAAAWQGHSEEVHRSVYLRFLGLDGGASEFSRTQPRRATRINDKYLPKN
jgi:integrase